MRKFCIFLSLLVIFLFTFKSNSLASTILFQDDFSNDNTSWDIFSGPGGNWVRLNGIFTGSVVKASSLDTFSYALTKQNFSNFSYNFKIRGDIGFDKKIMIRYQNNGTRYDLNLLNNYGTCFQKWLNYSSLKLWCKPYPYPVANQTWYSLKIEANKGQFKIYINEVLHHEIEDTNSPLLTGRIGLQAWPGFYDGYGSVTQVSFDDVKVESLESSEEYLTPLILIPGMGASWNSDVMLKDSNYPNTSWGFTPTVNTYDNLISTLKNLGYEDNKNLFIFYYDWRKPVSEIAQKLNEFVQQKLPINQYSIVGHSLGGLVARTFAQKYNPLQLEKLITVGAPHQGSVKSYYLWEGGTLPKNSKIFEKISIGILLQLNKKSFNSTVGEIKYKIPVLRDVLPTFTFLKENGIEKILSNDNQNNWLANLNNQINIQNLQKINTIGGNNFPTARWLNVGERSKIDEIFGRWVDGKPISEEYGDGDDTVLVESSKINGLNNLSLNLGHGDLIKTEQGQKAILDLLKLEGSTTPGQVQEINSALVLQICSPATISVYSPSGDLIKENSKLIVIPNPVVGIYKAIVKQENNGGSFGLIIGKLTPNADNWSQIEDTISYEQKEYNIFFENNTSSIQNDLIQMSINKLKLIQIKLSSLDKPSSIAFNGSIDLEIKKLEAMKDGKNIKIDSIIENIFNIQKRMLNNKVFASSRGTLENFKEVQDYLIQYSDNFQRDYSAIN